MTFVEKDSVEARVLVFPQNGIPRAGAHRFFLHESLGSLMRRDLGESSGFVDSTSPGLPQQWAGQIAFKSISPTLDFVRFMHSGLVVMGTGAALGDEELSAVILKQRVIYRNCVIHKSDGRQPNTPPQGDSAFETLQWRGKEPDEVDGSITNESHWQTVLSDDVPDRTRIQYKKQSPNRSATAETIESLAANQQLMFEIDWIGVAQGHTNAGGFVVTWGNQKYGIDWRYGAKPVLKRRVNGKWQTWKRFDEAPICTFTGSTIVRVRRWLGRLIISIDAHTWHILDTVPDGPASESRTPSRRQVNVTWPKGRLFVSTYGVNATLGVALFSTKESNKLPRTGDLVREIPHALRYFGPVSFPGVTRGWNTPSTRTKLKVEVNKKRAKYTLTLTADKAGIDTPAVIAVMAHQPSGIAAAPVEPLDLRRAVSSIEINSASPVIVGTSASQCTINLDRHSLRLSDSEWRTIVKKRRPIEVSLRWRMTDGSRTEWVAVFRGYIWKIAKSNPRYNDTQMRLTCLDDMIRLQKPSGIITERFGPMDYLLVDGKGKSIFGAHIAQEIFRVFLGEERAAEINGTGNPLEFNPHGFPLLSTEGDNAGYYTLRAALEGNTPPTQQGAMLPAPYFEDAISWLKQILRDDHCVCFFGYNPKAPTSWPVPIYGRWRYITAGRTPKVIPDARYVVTAKPGGNPDGDVDRVMQSASTENLPEKEINTVYVVSSAPMFQSPSPTAPSLIIAKARVPEDDPLAPEDSWESILVVKDDLIVSHQQAEALANGIMREVQGIERENPAISFRGDEYLTIGDLVTPLMEKPRSDKELDLSGKTFQVVSYKHLVQMNGPDANDFTTDVVLAPLSNSGF